MATTTVSVAEAEAAAEAAVMAEQRCGVYRDRLGLTVFRDLRSGSITLRADRQWAVMVPKVVGVQARRTLSRESSVSVYSINRTIWVFLSDVPARAIDAAEVSVLLCRVGAVPVLPGSCVALPTPGDERRCWLDTPGEGQPLPPFDVVVDAVLVAGRARWP